MGLKWCIGLVLVKFHFFVQLGGLACWLILRHSLCVGKSRLQAIPRFGMWVDDFVKHRSTQLKSAELCQFTPAEDLSQKVFLRSLHLIPGGECRPQHPSSNSLFFHGFSAMTKNESAHWCPLMYCKDTGSILMFFSLSGSSSIWKSSDPFSWCSRS